LNLLSLYSHSNWLELGTAAGVAPTNIPTWFDPGAAAYIAKVTAGGAVLWTGAYEKPQVGLQPHHDDRGGTPGLNKDNAGRTGHVNARMLAERATREWYRRFLAKLKTGPVDDSKLFTSPTVQVNGDMAKRASEGSSAAAAAAKLLGLQQR
jgi:hypothetical protein